MPSEPHLGTLHSVLFKTMNCHSIIHPAFFTTISYIVNKNTFLFKCLPIRWIVEKEKWMLFISSHVGFDTPDCKETIESCTLQIAHNYNFTWWNTDTRDWQSAGFFGFFTLYNLSTFIFTPRPGCTSVIWSPVSSQRASRETDTAVKMFPCHV